MGEGRGIYTVSMFHVVADCISFATTFFTKVISHSFRRSSSPNRTRCAGLRFGFGCKPEAAASIVLGCSNPLKTQCFQGIFLSSSHETDTLIFSVNL